MTSTTLPLSRSGLKLSYQSHGTGEPVVLLHGVGMQSAAWAPQIAALQGAYRVIALDLPGHGGSDALPKASTLQDFVDWCRDAHETLDVGPINLVGHSMGALIAGGYAASFPQAVRRVALLNGVYRRDVVARDAVTQRASEICNGNIDTETPLARWFGPTPEDQRVKRQVGAWLNNVDPEGYGTAYAAFAHGDATYADQFQQITCPFLALTGSDDPNSTPEMASAMCEQVQNGDAVVIAGHRHMVNLTAPDQVNAALLTWLQTPAKAEAATAC